jgi:hypothetical protein
LAVTVLQLKIPRHLGLIGLHDGKMADGFPLTVLQRFRNAPEDLRDTRGVLNAVMRSSVGSVVRGTRLRQGSVT